MLVQNQKQSTDDKKHITQQTAPSTGLKSVLSILGLLVKIQDNIPKSI